MKAFIQQYVSNSDKAVLQALIPFLNLKDSVVFTNKSNPNVDESKNEISESSYEYYQRRIDMSRIRQIEDFIIDSILDERDGIMFATLFPSSMILAVNVGDEGNTGESNELKHIDEETCELTFNSNVFIVDGQHRMMAMRRAYERMKKSREALSEEEHKFVLKYIENYKFNCVILVNYDLWEQGQVFVNVNFKQKPVNKSLYYEIFGSKYCENKPDWKRNTTYLAHCMARTLNEKSESPYYGKVKMLGTGNGYISQAFVVESLLRNFRKGGLWEYNVDNSEVQDDEYTYFATELLSYFYAIKKMFSNYWPKNDKPTIICKSTAFGAFVRLMEKVRSSENLSLKNELQKSSLFGEMCTKYVERVATVFAPLMKHADKLFGDKSEFKSTSGKGSEAKLYRRMKQIIENTYSNNPDLPNVLDTEEISIQLQEYFWSHPVEEIDSLAHSNEVEEIDNLKILGYEKNNNGYSVRCTFDMGVTLYIDNEDSKGFSMSFPSTCDAYFNVVQDSSILEDSSVNVKVNTNEYYK